MPLISNLKPLISDRKFGVAVGLQVASLQGTDPQQFQAWNTVQNAINDIYRQMTSSPTLEQLTVVDASGNVLAEIGDFTVGGVSYSGAAFAQVYIGPNADPSTAPFFSDGQHVVIGKNGIVEVQDMGGNVDATLGVTEESPLAISAATNASPSVVTIAGHGYIKGDTIVVAGAIGNTAINGQRIIANVTTNTFTMTDLSGTQINGNGAYGGSGTATRYYAGILAQTFATGPSFANFKLRAFADGSLKINDALITLNGANGTITIDPSLPDIHLVSNDILAGYVDIQPGTILISASGAAHYSPNVGELMVIGPAVFPQVLVTCSEIDIAKDNTVTPIRISAIDGSDGGGVIVVLNKDGTKDIQIDPAFGIAVTGNVTVGGVYQVGGTSGISSSINVGTSLTVNTASAITSVSGTGVTSTSGTFVTGVTLNKTAYAFQGGIRTS